MGFDHGLVGLPGENDKAELPVYDPVESAEIEDGQSIHGEEVSGFSAVMAPLIKTGGREDDPALAETVGKGLLLRGGFGAGVDEQPALLKAGEAEDRRDGNEPGLPRDDGRGRVPGEDIAGFILTGILLLHDLKNGEGFLIRAAAGKTVSAAHTPYCI